MQTVNFNCPHCGNLMAVGTNLLGRNVRCPHCRQVVRAPSAAGEPSVQAPAPPPPTPPPAPQQVPSFSVPKPTEHHESIFGERHDEDVFGSEPPKPVLPTPPSPSPPPPPPPPLPEQLAETVSVNAFLAPAPFVPPQLEPEPQLEYEPPTPAASLDFSPSTGGALDRRQPEPQYSEEPERSDRGYRPRPVRDEAPGTPAFAWILLAYAAVITIVAGFFGFQYFTSSEKSAHPYKAMPDVLRQYDPAKKPQVSFQGLPDPKLDVPQELRVKLGSELTVGDLRVQPLYVEKMYPEVTTKYASDPDKTRPIGKQTIALTLRVKNLSPDTTFYPNDPAFTRAVDLKQEQPAPYTALQIDQHYYYGMFKWPPDAGTVSEFVVGHEADQQPLKPGEERDTWAVVAPSGMRAAGSTDIMRDLGDLKSNQAMLWRVQLRRGFVKMPDENGKEVEVSATTVIGVEFTPSQIK